MTSYIEERINHGAGERIVYLTRLSLWSLLPQFLFAALCCVVSLVLVLYLPETGALARYALLIAICPILVAGVILVKAFVTYYTTEIGLTNHRLMMKTGFIARNTPEMQLEKIEMQELQQSAAGRMCGYGTLHVRGAGDQNMVIRSVNEPILLTDRITDAMGARNRDLLERAHARTTAADAA